jgi:hypothetical protein
MITANLTGTVTGSLIGNAFTATSATSFTGPLAGDVSGNQDMTTVTKLQGQAVASTVPLSGQVLTWSGSTWSPQTPSATTTLSVASKSANYTLTTADAGKYFLVNEAGTTTITLLAVATAGAGYSVTIKNVSGTTKVVASGSEQIDGSVASIVITNKGSVQLATDGAAWYQVYGVGSIGRDGVACGSDCYANTDAMSYGSAYTASGKYLTLANGVWVQSDGTNVLRVDGTDNWHYALNANGKDWSGTLLNKTTATLGGRVCPDSVYVNDSNKVATGRCLYYDQGNASQKLDAAGTSQNNQATMGLAKWNVADTGNGTGAAWYEGNIKTCADKGMRLPTLYETTATKPTGSLPADASPTFNAAKGVPGVSGSSTRTWTSSPYTHDPSFYWIFQSGINGAGLDVYSVTYAVRCVLP